MKKRIVAVQVGLRILAPATMDPEQVRDEVRHGLIVGLGKLGTVKVKLIGIGQWAVEIAGDMVPTGRGRGRLVPMLDGHNSTTLRAAGIVFSRKR